MLAPTPSRTAHWRLDAVIALTAAAAVLALHALGGFATLQNAGGDNDSLLRLVQVRDLIAGQGWFDLHQYRMGPEGGFVMHWSRLVDAPIAAIIIAVQAFSGNAALADTVALVWWPTILLAAALYFILRTARSHAGDEASFPAIVIGAVSLRFSGIFDPGAIDHHNVQLVLALASISFLLDAALDWRKAVGAGACVAMMLAIGMETAPYVLVAGGVVAFWFLLLGAGTARAAAGFGIALGALSASIFVAVVPLSSWAAAECDAYSIVQFAVAAVGGFGLALIAMSQKAQSSLALRMMLLSALAGSVAVLVLVFFPECLADPYAGVDPRLRTYWLDAVTEAQPIWQVVAKSPTMAATYYATPLLALVIMALRFWRRGFSRSDYIVAAFLGAAFLISLWQVRGAMFSVPFAIVPLAAWVAERRRMASGKAPFSKTMKMVTAWILSFSLTWAAAAAGISDVFDRTTGAKLVDSKKEDCQASADFATLNEIPATRVLASSNLGSPILRYTKHSVLAGPYHRNNAGNLLVLDSFMEPAAATRRVVRDQAIDVVAFCPGNGESAALAAWAPTGLMAALTRGEPPGWLEIIPSTATEPLRLYRVRAD